MSRAVQYRRFGGPDVLEMVQVADRPPGPGRVAVSVHAAGLNPVDAKTFEGAFPVRPAEFVQRLRHPRRWLDRTFPRTVGRDFAGVVDGVGAGVEHVRAGQTVLGTLRSAPGDAATTGSLTTRLIAPAEDVVVKPERLGFHEAAALGVAAQTACGALRALDIGAGDLVAISGASGSVGALATQLAVRRGATVIGIAGASSAEHLRRLGAIPVDYEGDVSAQIRAVAPRPVSAFVDCYGGDYVNLALALGIPAGRVGTLVPSPTVFRKGARFTGSRHARPGDLDMVAGLVAEGAVHVQIGRVLPFDLEAVRTGYADLLAGHVRGKLVVDIAGPESTEGPRPHGGS